MQLSSENRSEGKKLMDCSVGIIVHNEAQNIGKLIKALQEQRTLTVLVREIIVVSSASTDGTDEIVRMLAQNDLRITLITEEKRNGKAAAINKFIGAATGDLLIEISGDVLPACDVIEKLATAFADPEVGMAGGRPLPENTSDTFIGYAVNLLWRLHHRMALISPKLGEMIAFRKVFEQLPAQSAVDEASIEALVRQKGYRLCYLPDALIHNRGPESLAEFIAQRRRIAAGHYWLQKNQHYTVSSQNANVLLKITLAELKEHPLKFPKICLVMFLELYCRFLGWYDLHLRKKNPFTWQMITSTKKLKRQA